MYINFYFVAAGNILYCEVSICRIIVLIWELVSDHWLNHGKRVEFWMLNSGLSWSSCSWQKKTPKEIYEYIMKNWVTSAHHNQLWRRDVLTSSMEIKMQHCLGGLQQYQLLKFFLSHSHLNFGQLINLSQKNCRDTINIKGICWVYNS